MGQGELTPLTSTASLAYPAISTPTGAAASGLGFRHEALLYTGGDQGFVEGTLALDPDAYSGRGIWIANQLCELVQIRSAPPGTVVRVHWALA
jgi:hypothetical protein